MRARIGIWSALTVLLVAAGSLVVVVARDGGDETGPPLPLALSASGAEAAAGSGDAALAAGATSLIARVVYVADDDLPRLGGTAAAYRQVPAVDRDGVERVAAALDIDGEPAERDGGWHLDGQSLSLFVDGASGVWYANPSVSTPPPPPPMPGAEPGGPVPEPCPDDPAVQCAAVPPGVVDPTVAPPAGQIAPGEPNGSAPPAGSVEPAPPVPERQVERPADLPTEDEARSRALDVLTAAGLDVRGADVSVDDLGSLWSVTVEPAVDGRPVPGSTSSVAVGGGGRIEGATGALVTFEEVGEYDLLDTRVTLDRLNEGGWGFGGAVTLPAPVGPAETAPPDPPATTVPPVTTVTTVTTGGGAAGPDSPVTTVTSGGGAAPPGSVAPPPGGAEPAPRPRPTQLPPVQSEEPAAVEVQVTGVEPVLVGLPSWDGSGLYLVPGYRFTAEDGATPVVPAVTDDALDPPPDEPEPAPVPGDVDPGAPDIPAEPGGGAVGADPDTPVDDGPVITIEPPGVANSSG